MKIILILGYSGIGKTTIGRYFEREKEWIHIELDKGSQDKILSNSIPFPSGDKLNKSYFDYLRDFLGANRFNGAVITMPSTIVINQEVSKSLNSIGVKTVYLIAPTYLCLEEFLRRENETGRNLSAYHWIKHNTRLCEFLTLPIHNSTSIFIDVTNGRERLSLGYIYDSICEQI